jgi:DNA-binding CsgD family transcriptional regulator
MAFGVIIADAEGRVAFANRYAKDLLASGGGLSLDKGRLVARSCAETKQLLALVCRAARMAPGETAPGKTAPAEIPMVKAIDNAMQVCGTAPCGPISVVVTPLAYTETKGAPTGAVLFCHDRERELAPPSALLAQLYRLTPCEAGLARHLLQGEGLGQAARALSISRNTARTHLKRIFQKTQTKRQADLLHLMLRDLAALRFEAAQGPEQAPER